MKVFVIHKFTSQKLAKSQMKTLKKSMDFNFEPIFMPVSSSTTWKVEAVRKLEESELVLVFEPEKCAQSENANWEIERAKSLDKSIYETDNLSTDKGLRIALKREYDLIDEFLERFGKKSGNFSEVLELYKIMVDTSENLVMRRQRTNAFFITIIGSLSALAGILVNQGPAIESNTSLYLILSVAAYILCRSWGRQIDNYGKLNNGKFAVILELEKQMPARVFDAEWIALGNGIRPEKYKSFTETEKQVPRLFSYLLSILILILSWNLIPSGWSKNFSQLLDEIITTVLPSIFTSL